MLVDAPIAPQRSAFSAQNRMSRTNICQTKQLPKSPSILYWNTGNQEKLLKNQILEDNGIDDPAL